MNRKIAILILLLIGANISNSQDINDKKGIVKDTLYLKEAFLKGTLYGQSRLMSITTNNQNGLSDYYATAIGLGLGYRSAYYKGFQINIGGFLTQDIASSDFTVQDPTTKAIDRYEVGLYDLADVNRKNLLFRLQLLFLKYKFKNSSILVGNYIPKNLFLNAQDGRMSPTMVQGVTFDLNPNKKIQIKLDLILGVSPRSTTHWYSVENSLGYYPIGVNLNGTKSQYFGNISSTGIGILDVNYTPILQFKVLIGNILAENIFNTAYIKAEYTHDLNKTKKLLFGAMFITQHSVGNGGNSDILKTYYPTQNKSNIINARIGYTTKTVESSINFGRITADGRYLMPREWGVEQFYTFLPRERMEGSGDVWAYSAKFAKNWFNKSLKTEIGYGYYRLSDVKNTNLNKYGMPSFAQFTASINYQFRGFLRGTNAQFLYVQKNNQGDIYDNERYEINKVNMSQLNFILNYQF